MVFAAILTLEKVFLFLHHLTDYRQISWKVVTTIWNTSMT